MNLLLCRSNCLNMFGYKESYIILHTVATKELQILKCHYSRIVRKGPSTPSVLQAAYCVLPDIIDTIGVNDTIHTKLVVCCVLRDYLAKMGFRPIPK